MTKTLTEVLKERVLLLDGGMGTQIFANNPTVEDYGGLATEGCVELMNERRPEWIRAIHASYFDAGADAVETNTFGANEIVLAEFGLGHRARDLNIQAVRLAKEVARSYATPKFVIGSVGPGTKLVTLGHIDYATLYRSYLGQMQGLLEGGADAILIETCQDLGQIKAAVRAAKAAMAEAGQRIPLWVQATVETTGTLLVGSDIGSVLTSVEALGVDVLGLNCATGPEEMHAHLAHLAECSPFAISCLPNAGLPRNEGGRTVYPLGPEAFAEKVAHATEELGLSIVGGCCGTTPAHIRELAGRVGSLEAPRRSPSSPRSVASLYQSISLDVDIKPLIVGERTNANGSKKFRELLAKEDYEALAQLAKEQQKEGAHLLDVCVAFVGRDEVRDMEEFLRRAVVQTTAPLMIDSTEVPVIERALQLAPGKCVVNSINFEDGEAKARKILDLCKAYGAAVVALTIDERGMAKSVEDRVAVAQGLYDLVVGEYGIPAGDLIIDPLTFTLGSGDEGFRRSALDTLDAIEAIKGIDPELKTILGLSNVSFGLAPGARQILNSLMLYHAVKRGLDLAILNASKIVPISRLSSEERALFEDLLFDRRAEGYDPLKDVVNKHAGAAVSVAKVDRRTLPVEERLRQAIIDGEKQAIVADVDEALESHPALDIINKYLLAGMKVVGERFGAGEMQLPFVLESAETMKAAVARLEPFIPKTEGYEKGHIILATVKGDVHDIGKNLVEIILSNNGYRVTNLGIKQPIEAILARFLEERADAIGLSGLLVKSTAIMRENLQHLASLGIEAPVILGGAALSRDYVERDCRAVYGGAVLYAEDAFEGLRHMEALMKGELDLAPATVAATPAIRVLRKGDRSVQLTSAGRSGWVKEGGSVPAPPFWGTRILEDRLEELFGYLDTFALLRNRWGFQQGALGDDAFEILLREKAQPTFEQWKGEVIGKGLLIPRAVYGYFPVEAEGDRLRVFDTDRKETLALLELPRQSTGRRLCIADFFRSREEGGDVLPLQIVSLGDEAAHHAAQLYANGRYTDYFYFHGLATELTEAYAELLHARVRRELGIHPRDAQELRLLFSQGYQGSRYSYGYPACPDLEGNAEIHRLLDAGRIGMRITENFQMDPEYATSALVAWHPQARYFSV